MLKFENIHKKFGENHVLKGINLEIKKGDFVAIIGASGCGKTTLIRTVNGFVVPDTGKVSVDSEEVDFCDMGKMRKIRKRVGMIYQLFNLVERTSTMHNVLTGVLGSKDKGMDFLMTTIGMFGKENNAKAFEILKFVGLEDKVYDRVDKLSGGQKQRVAIARALMQNPTILLADEPVANLDPKASKRIIELLKKVNQEKEITVVTVIHHMDFVKEHFSRVIALKEGVVSYDGSPDGLTIEILDDIYGAHKEEMFEYSVA